MATRPKPPEDERDSLEVAVKGDRRSQLAAMRDYIAHQLEGNLCNSCLNSRLRTGDQASLLLRLSKVLEEIDQLPEVSGEVSTYDQLRARRDAKLGTSEAPDSAQSRGLGTKSGERRQGGRRPSVDGGAQS